MNPNALIPVITNAGINAFLAHSGNDKVKINKIALGDGNGAGYVPDPTAPNPTLVNQLEDFSLSGGVASDQDNVLHLTAVAPEDPEAPEYNVREVGIFIETVKENGEKVTTLFAIYATPETPDQPLAFRSNTVPLLLAFDLLLDNIDKDDIDFIIGDGDIFSIPTATTTTPGVVKIANAAEVRSALYDNNLDQQTLDDLNGRAITPLGLTISQLDTPDGSQVGVVSVDNLGDANIKNHLNIAGAVKGSSWRQSQKLQASDVQANDFFGKSISIDGDRAIVGAYQEDPDGISDAGSAYVFHWNGSQWVEQQKLQASDAEGNAKFGSSVSISGDRAIVGAARENPDGHIDAGSAYVFHWDVDEQKWKQQEKLQAKDAEAEDLFGYSVSISGDRAIVGAVREDLDGVSNAGSAYVFHWDVDEQKWKQQEKLQAGDAQEGDWFGRSVSISGDRAIVGAHFEDTGGILNGGSAYVFHWDLDEQKWKQQPKLEASDPQDTGLFGSSVSISGDRAMVGAPGEDTGGTVAGSAYVFHWDVDEQKWKQQEKLQAEDAEAEDLFGCSVSISGDRAIVGAYEEDPDGISGAGSAYVFHWDVDEQKWNQQEKLQADDAEGGDQFGFSVSISGDRAMVGAYQEDPDGVSNAGSAYFFSFGDLLIKETIYVVNREEGSRVGIGTNLPREILDVNGTLRARDLKVDDTIKAPAFAGANGFLLTDSWPELQKLQASDAETNDNFGFSVSIDGDRAIVGAYQEDPDGISDAGSAYVFHWNGSQWVEQQKLQAEDAEAEDLFGCSVSISGDRAIVGAYGKDIGVNPDEWDAGSAYVFHWDVDEQKWNQQEKLQADDAEGGDQFGKAVSISGDRAIVGAYEEDPDGISGAGSAYVFHWDVDEQKWNQQEKLQADDAEANDSFGRSVSISGDRAIVGASREDTGGTTNVGSAYVFHWDVDEQKWKQLPKLQASDGEFGDRFGRSVSISADRVIVGAHFEKTGGTDAGSAYVFHWDGSQWVEQQKLQASDAEGGDLFGNAVSISGDRAIVGAHLEDSSSTNVGSAYIYQWNGSRWVEQRKLQASDAQEKDEFGFSVSISGDRAIVGAHLEDTGGVRTGSAYLFTTGWELESNLGVDETLSAKNILAKSLSANNNSGSSTIDARNSGSGYALLAENVGTGKAARIQAATGVAMDILNTGSSNTVYIKNDGTGGALDAASYGVAPTVFISNVGDGSGLQVSKNRLAVEPQGATIAAFAVGGGFALSAFGDVFVEGTIQTFTGAHEAIINVSVLNQLKPGLLLSLTGTVFNRLNEAGEKIISTALPVVKLADSRNDKHVFGVFNAESKMQNHWHELEANERLVRVNALGDGLAWVTNINGDIEAGDYITTSEIAGYGMKQEDDILHNYTLAKATEAVDWNAVTEMVEHNGQQYKAYLIAVAYFSS